MMLFCSATNKRPRARLFGMLCLILIFFGQSLVMMVHATMMISTTPVVVSELSVNQSIQPVACGGLTDRVQLGGSRLDKQQPVDMKLYTDGGCLLIGCYTTIATFDNVVLPIVQTSSSSQNGFLIHLFPVEPNNGFYRPPIYWST